MVVIPSCVRISLTLSSLGFDALSVTALGGQLNGWPIKRQHCSVVNHVTTSKQSKCYANPSKCTGFQCITWAPERQKMGLGIREYEETKERRNEIEETEE